MYFTSQRQVLITLRDLKSIACTSDNDFLHLLKSGSNSLLISFTQDFSFLCLLICKCCSYCMGASKLRSYTTNSSSAPSAILLQKMLLTVHPNCHVPLNLRRCLSIISCCFLFFELLDPIFGVFNVYTVKLAILIFSSH